MTHHSERTGGRIAFTIGSVIACAIFFGSAIELGFYGKPADGVFAAAGVVFSVGAVIGIGVGAYNMGRERGK